VRLAGWGAARSFVFIQISMPYIFKNQQYFRELLDQQTAVGGQV